MNKDHSKLFRLFMATFTLSAFTFGGGYVIVPLMQKRFVEDFKWLDQREMMDMVCIAQSSPGPIAVNTSILVGYRIAGVIGALVTVLGTTLPPLITLSIVSLFYAAIRDNPTVNLVLMGMQAGVAAVVTGAVIGMIRNILRLRRILPVLLMIAVFIASAFFSVNVIYILLICGAIGIVDMIVARTKPLSSDLVPACGAQGIDADNSKKGD